jgi:DNA-binding GntR family transcriptional regulator
MAIPFETIPGPVMADRPVVGSSLTNELAFRIQEDILRGVLAPGTRLFQEQLSERYGVSRTPLREAIHRLEAQGLVTKLPNRGVVVRRLSERELQEIYVVRAELEGFAASLAASKADAELLGRMDAAQERLSGAIDELRRTGADAAPASLNDRIASGNTEFHVTIREAAGNQRLGDVVRSLEDAFPKDYVWRSLTSEAEMLALNVDEHIAIRDAVAAADADLARLRMQDHVMHAWSLLSGYLRSLGFWD